ncbi:MAG: RluA family pseudouridine synthase [Muribaculaceae bacterium]|nr:RluA family pseudouridine synthase [Muribaculaceae bacterium]
MPRFKAKPIKPGAEKRPLRPDTIFTFNVEAPSPLLEFLFSAMPDRKRTNTKELLKYNQVMVNGDVTRRFDQPLEPGDRVEVNITRPFVTFYNRRIQMVYEDDYIIVVNKGYGLLSMGNDKIKEGTAYSILRDYLKTKDPRNKIFIVHRLDQHTSGLMVFAKTIEAKEGLQHNWNNMVRRRQYVCVVEGKPEQTKGEVRSYLAENSQHTVYSTQNPEEGQLALTRYEAVKSANGYTLVEVELETGRKNQIRVHMHDLGHSIAGDRRYGAKTSPIHRLALHARTLEFIHPVTRKLMSFSTPVPAAFLSMVK